METQLPERLLKFFDQIQRLRRSSCRFDRFYINTYCKIYLNAVI